MTEASQQQFKAVRLADRGSISATLIDLLTKGMEKGVFEAVLVPMKVPQGDGFAYIMIKDRSLLAEACPLPPVVSMQGGIALSALTRRGNSPLKIAAVMRPCEMRATIELVKLGQVDLTNVTLISMDCPGALRLKDFSQDPRSEETRFEKAIREGRDDDVRPICQICHRSSQVSGDLHLGQLGSDGSYLPLLSNSPQGDKVLAALSLTSVEDVTAWGSGVAKVTDRRAAAREAWHLEYEANIEGTENLLKTLATCIDCHNCMRVCPVCYCRLCYFDSDKIKHPADDYLDQAKSKGCLRFPPDMLLFHLGRMTHMSLTCVSCGACEDACPASIPIARIFSYVADKAQGAFDYVPGRSRDDPQPLIVYKEQEHLEEGE